MKIDSIDVAKASVRMAISSREEEKVLEEQLKKQNILTVAVDVGGNLNNSIPKIVERALVASKRCGLIQDCHLHDGAVAGATREAIIQVVSKANGLNVGGKIGIARSEEHLSVCLFMSIGLLHLNEVVIGLGHRTIADL
ncbi:HutP family protein [Clostridium cochlearium]|uniref:Hut operon positive regulatory protein n=1 Tax=Clostridium cochlearium TaxID=1494 RepID=A0A239ZZD9_CLOCO|nr:HutP family protein [Clostridium cochlearium]MBV1821821.1 HutP family protein [Bacteroidales bacterium MSK.15.36]NSJ90613.1 hut operon positive regulator HutP [Coprococcus sp. MSK.21.13]MBE6064381.1 hut operon positive regulator HutP [Clostridium cochlearium]MBU5268827.1 HutP family protein [Clostridium cochlearium]MCG4570899.1 HutP family protein [Clostridium cochlearium]